MADKSATMAAQADRFSRIAAVARRDVDHFSQGMYQHGDVGVWPEMDPLWCGWRTKKQTLAAKKKKQEPEEDESIAKAVAMTAGMDEQVGAMKRQLEEQSLQLKALAAGHQAQANFHEQLVTVLSSAQQTKSKPQAATIPSNKPRRHTGNQNQTPQEYHTLTWLSSQKHGKHERSVIQGYKPSTRASPSSVQTQENKHESGSDRSRTTFGGTNRGFGKRSVWSDPIENMAETRTRNVKAAPRSAPAEKALTFKPINQVPLVTTMYAKCKRRSVLQKKTLAHKPTERTFPGMRTLSSSPLNRQLAEEKLHEHSDSSHLEHHEEHQIAKESSKNAQTDDSILDPMLTVHKYEDELKLRWLVPDEKEQKRDIGKAILEEMRSYRTGLTPRIQEAVQNTVDKQWPKKQQLKEPSYEDWIIEELIDEELKGISTELLAFCDELVEHMYISEFLH